MYLLFNPIISLYCILLWEHLYDFSYTTPMLTSSVSVPDEGNLCCPETRCTFFSIKKTCLSYTIGESFHTISCVESGLFTITIRGYLLGLFLTFSIHFLWSTTQVVTVSTSDGKPAALALHNLYLPPVLYWLFNPLRWAIPLIWS